MACAPRPGFRYIGVQSVQLMFLPLFSAGSIGHVGCPIDVQSVQSDALRSRTSAIGHHRAATFVSVVTCSTASLTASLTAFLTISCRATPAPLPEMKSETTSLTASLTTCCTTRLTDVVVMRAASSLTLYPDAQSCSNISITRS